jgi:hypothetical protein
MGRASGSLLRKKDLLALSARCLHNPVRPWLASARSGWWTSSTPPRSFSRIYDPTESRKTAAGPTANHCRGPNQGRSEPRNRETLSLAGPPMPARLERTGEKQRTAQPSESTTKVVARELANPGEIRATVWSNADQPSHTATAAHTSTTLASVAGVRRVRTRGRGARLNRPPREEETSIK